MGLPPKLFIHLSQRIFRLLSLHNLIMIQQRFADLEARQMEFNNRLWEAVRIENAQTVYETHQRLTEQIQREREFFLKFIQSHLNLHQPPPPPPPNQ